MLGLARANEKRLEYYRHVRSHCAKCHRLHCFTHPERSTICRMRAWLASVLLIVVPAIGIDALVNNAGVTGSIESQTLATLDRNEFERILRVNSFAPFAISSGYGSIASVESLAESGYPSAYFYAMNGKFLSALSGKEVPW